MKSIFLTLSLSLTFLFSQAQTKFFEGNWQAAFDLAQKENKYLFVDCHTDWCGWCKVADKSTFPDENVAEVLNSKFVSVKVDMECGAGVYLAMKYRVTGFPSYLMFSPDGSYAHKMTGYYENPEDFIAQLKLALNEDERFAYPTKLTDKTAFPSFYASVFTNKDSEEKRTKPEQKDIDFWLDGQEDLKTEAAWSVMYRFPLNDKYSELFLKNKKEYAKLFGKAEVTDKISGMGSDLLRVAMESESESDLKLALDFVERNLEENVEETKSFFQLRFWEAKKDWRNYVKTAQGIIDRESLKEHLGGVNNYSWTIYENVEDPALLKTAIGWMAEVVRIDPLYMYLDTYAALYYKIGSYDDAIIWAEKAIAAGKESDENVSATEELRDQIIAAKEAK